MTAATVEAPTTDGSQPVAAEAEKTRHDIFKYADYVHVGPGVEECELTVALNDPERDRTKPLPTCDDPDHFHGWCRLPNPFQVKDIAEKGQAARARKIRMLRNPETDAHVVLEQELDALRDPSATVREMLADEIVDKDFAQDYDAAMSAVMDTEVEDWTPPDDDQEAEPPKLYANIIQDQEEFARQKDLPEEQRDDTFEELERTVAAFTRALSDELESVQKPKKEALLQKSSEELVEIIRRDRIDTAGQEAFLHTYNTWQWFVCTFKIPPKGRPSERVWKDIVQFKYDTPADVVRAVQEVFKELESRMAGDRAGNS